MNKIINKFLLAGDKFIPEIHLRQSGFAYSASGPFNENKERIQKFKGIGDWEYIYQNELEKACFHHDTAYWDFKDLPARTDKAFGENPFNIAKNSKCDEYKSSNGL